MSVRETIETLKVFSYLGENILEDGSILIGRAPHIAPLAWLHSIYSPLTENEIWEIEKKIGDMPNAYKEFLLIANGLGVFNTTLSLYGLRRNYKRQVPDVWQPFDIVIPNTLEKPANANENVFIIGGYDWDGSYLYIDKLSGRVHICDRDNANSLYEWGDFENMLSSEIKRLSSLFDKDGKEFDPDECTLPFDN